MKVIKNRYYFNVGEMLNGELDGRAFNEFTSPFEGLFKSHSVEDGMYNFFKHVDDSQTYPEEAKFFQDYLSTKVNEFCFASWNEKLVEDDTILPDANKFYGRFLEWWRETKEVYIPLIKIFADQANNLMKGVSSTQSSTMTDTGKVAESNYPTSSTFASYPTSDEIATASQTTNTSTGSSTSEVASEDVIDHLDKVRRKVVDLYAEWLRSFTNRFIIFMREE